LTSPHWMCNLSEISEGRTMGQCVRKEGKMVRAATQLVIVVGLLSHNLPLAGQNELPASHANQAASNLLVGSGESIPRTLQIEGKVASVEGEPSSGATVWVASLASPAQQLASTQTDSEGDYSLRIALPLPEATGSIILGANHPECLAARELLDLRGLGPVVKSSLLLPRLDEKVDGPDLDVVEAWLLPRLARSHDCRAQAESACRTLREMIVRFRKRPLDWEAVEQILDAVRQSGLPQFRPLACLALMRMGSWQGAGKVLASNPPPAGVSEEELVLRAVRWSFLRRTDEARQDLAQARAMDPRSPLIELELGRVAVQEEDWAAAAAMLDPPLREARLAPQAHYLRARAMIALGDFESAALEADALARDLRRKRLPPDTRGFVNDLQRRLHERSIQPIADVENQPVAELKEAAGELQGLDPSSPPPPGGLGEFMRQVGSSVEETLSGFSNTIGSELIRQTQLASSGKPRTARSMECSYVFTHRNVNGHIQIHEYRGNKEGHTLSPGRTEGGFMVTSGFVSTLMIFHPEFQAHTSYRYLGSQSLAGQQTYVIGFAQKAEALNPLGRFIVATGKVTSFYVQGIAWISPDHRVMRLHTDLLHPVSQINLNRETSEIDYRPYHFLSSPTTFLLPTRVTVSVEYGRKRLRNEHIFTKFQLFNVEVHDEGPSALPALAGSGQNYRLNPNNDNVHVNRGLALDMKGNLDAAMGEYREALRLNPKNDLAHFDLGMALDDKSDLEGAIAEFREALRLKPGNEYAHASLGSALYKLGHVDAAIAEYREVLRLDPQNDAAHYNLGIALGTQGNLSGAISETRAALRLDPNNPQLHYSLAYWLENQGDRDGALGEYRMAYSLSPENSQFKRAYERLARKPKAHRASGKRKTGEGV
jgi:tetratricopeptide (TPR) repeat protein